jgi:hypothetical protein
MKRGLTLWFLLVLVAMLALTTWASLQENVLDAFLRLGRDPWGLATLFDAYFAFLAFWLWVTWRERTWSARGAWLLAILALGNLAMAAYVLLALRGLPAGANPDDLLRRKSC